MKTWRRVAWALLLGGLLLLLLLAWQAYLQPGMLLDFLNLRYCG